MPPARSYRLSHCTHTVWGNLPGSRSESFLAPGNLLVPGKAPHAVAARQVRELLAKLQAVFDLPRRLHTAIARGALELAVGYYADAAPLLRRYGHKARPAGAVTGLSGQACLFQAGGVLVSGETA
jgi:hypothetical protein